ncbi:MAG: hypothetical protein WCK35_13285 [Chloroflexota bacterium]
MPRPDIFIFLDAPLEVLYNRKQEAEPQQVQALIERHRAYMARIPAGFTVDASQSPAQVTRDVSQIISRTIEGIKIQALFWFPLGLLLTSGLID